MDHKVQKPSCCARKQEKRLTPVVENWRELASENPSSYHQSALNHIAKVLLKTPSKIVISPERFADTHAPLNCFSKHLRNSNSFFPFQPLCKSISNANAQSLISVCLRDPFRYLRSKYLRTVIQREATNQRALSPKEYIYKQTLLENHHPGTSALTPAMHAQFIKQLQQHSLVKAFGFQELLASNDTFSLMGMEGEDKYAFRDFPRENKLPFTEEEEKEAEIEIAKALKQYGYYNLIIKSQMFE